MNLELVSRIPANSNKIPLLFVHGAWHGAWCWEEHFQPYFEKAGYPTIVFSLRGHGLSDGDVSGASLDDYLTDLRKVAGRLAKPPVMIAHSLGGYLVQKYIEQYDVAGAVLMAAMLPFPGPMRLLSYPLVKPVSIWQRRRILPTPRKPESVRKVFFTPDLPDSQLERYSRRLCDESFYSYLELMLVRKIKAERMKRVPTLILANTTDTMRKFMCRKETAALYGAQFREYTDTGHDMMLGVQWEKVASDILSWLETAKPGR